MARGRKKWFQIMSVQHLHGKRKEKMVENHVSPTSKWQEEGKWLKIMSVQQLDGRRKEKMVANHVSPTSSWQEEGKNG